MRNSAVVITVAVCVLAVLLTRDLGRSEADAAAVIADLEQQAVKADLATDGSFYEKHLADDWSGGSSYGQWETKASLLRDMSHQQTHHIESESISDLKVRVYGDTAVATYNQSYRMFDHGRRHERTVITTDTWVRRNDRWQEVASHSSEAQ